MHILDEKIADAKHAVDIANRGDFGVEEKERIAELVASAETSRKIRSAIFNEEYMVLEKILHEASGSFHAVTQNEVSRAKILLKSHLAERRLEIAIMQVIESGLEDANSFFILKSQISSSQSILRPSRRLLNLFAHLCLYISDAFVAKDWRRIEGLKATGNEKKFSNEAMANGG